MSESVSSPTRVSVTTRKKKKKKSACLAHSSVEIIIKCRRGSPERTAVLPFFILLETEMVEDKVCQLLPSHLSKKHYVINHFLRACAIWTSTLQGKYSIVSFKESQTVLFLVVQPTRLKNW